MKAIVLRLLIVAVLSTIGIPVAKAQQITSAADVQYPATGIWNTFLSQLNVIECNNYAATVTSVQVDLRNASGDSITLVPFNLPSSGTFHLIVNPFVPTDSYGTYQVSLPGATTLQSERVRCITAFYRFSPAGASKLLEYAYALPVMDPQQGTTGGTFNSFNPEDGPVPVQNWLSIVNVSGSSLSGSVEVYSQDGALANSIPVDSIPANGRRDIPLGHNTGESIGLYRFVPNSGSQSYFAFVIRYSSGGTGFNFAFPLFASRGTCSSEPVFASTMNPAYNWAEIANLTNDTASLTLEVRNSVGTVVGSTPISLPPFSQEHVFINQFLGEANTGSMRIVCDSSSSQVFVQSMFYGRLSASLPTVSWSYARQQFGYGTRTDEVLAVPANTYLGLANWFRVFDRSSQAGTVDVETFSQTGDSFRQLASFPASGSADIPLHSVLPADSVGGSIAGARSTGNSLAGDLIRVLPDSTGRIGVIMPIPAAIVPGQIVPISLQQVVSGLSSPVFVTNAGDGTNRLFVVEQYARIRIISNGTILSTPFLNLSEQVATGGEQGLLGLAFHPNYENNRRFFVMFVDTAQDLRVVEYEASTGNANVANPTAIRNIITIDHPFSNHNGGHLAFGNDGFLYIGTGDGGGGGDPEENGQDTTSLLGKILRIDVDGAAPYTVPSNNPFVGVAGADEIWAYGLRNPYRFSVDRATGRIFIGDVGQGTREEIDIGVLGGNFGWDVMEGSLCFEPSSGCDQSGKILPISEYGHDLGFSVTGGYVYRGTAISGLVGQYLFADFGSGRIWALEERADSTWQRTELLDTSLLISGFGEDESGELYVVNYSGTISRIVPG